MKWLAYMLANFFRVAWPRLWRAVLRAWAWLCAFAQTPQGKTILILLAVLVLAVVVIRRLLAARTENPS